MDIRLAVEEIYLDADFRRADTYEELVATWEDGRKVPTYEELEIAWVAVEVKLQVAADLEAELEQMRIANALEGYLDVDDYNLESAAIQTLARKVAWLERELLR